MSRLTHHIGAIRARVISQHEGYAVHIPCLSEATAKNPLGTIYFCHGCDRQVSPDEVAEQGEAQAYFLADMQYLLDLVDDEVALRLAKAMGRPETEHEYEPDEGGCAVCGEGFCHYMHRDQSP